MTRRRLLAAGAGGGALLLTYLPVFDDAEDGRVSLENGRRRVHVPITGGNGLRPRNAPHKQAKLLLTSGAREVLLGDARDTRIQRLEDIDKAVDSVDPSLFSMAFSFVAAGTIHSSLG